VPVLREEVQAGVRMLEGAMSDPTQEPDPNIQKALDDLHDSTQRMMGRDPDCRRECARLTSQLAERDAQIATLTQERNAAVEGRAEEFKRVMLFEQQRDEARHRHAASAALSMETMQQLTEQRDAALAREQTLREALESIVDDLKARWDMNAPSTNEGIRGNVQHAERVLRDPGAKTP